MKRRTRTAAPAHPLVAQLLEHCYASPLTQEELAARSGVPSRVFINWFNNAAPQLSTFEALLNTLGYKLIIVKDERK